jgi:hypothetical protein
MNTTIYGQVPVLEVTRSEVFEDEHISEKLLRERRIPTASFNVDLVEVVSPEFIFKRVEEEFQKLGLEVRRVALIVAPCGDYSLVHIHVSNRRIGRYHMEKLVVVLVEGKFVSVTTLP